MSDEIQIACDGCGSLWPESEIEKMPAGWHLRSDESGKDVIWAAVCKKTSDTCLVKAVSNLSAGAKQNS